MHSGGINTVAAPLAAELAKRQNPDGGWGYTNGSSWTEPTSLALIALNTTGAFQSAQARGATWLRAHQREDGGWPPRPGVQHSTWVTAAALLVPEVRRSPQASDALNWVLNKSGRESTVLERLRRLMLGKQAEVGEGTVGWPWFPDTAGWVTPTTFSVLALRGFPEDSRVAVRIAQGQQFLLARTCIDGGWNHGAAKALGYVATSYPDTTGQALLALRGIADTRVNRAIELARSQIETVRSSESASWLQLGLLSHGRHVTQLPPSVCRNTNALSLRIIATAARNKNAFL